MQQQSNCSQRSNRCQSVTLSSLIEPVLQRKTVAVPLEFEFLPVEFLSKQFTKLNSSHSYRIHYLGPRFINTLALHKKYAFAEKCPLETATVLQGRSPLERYRVDMRKVVQSYTVQEKLRGNSFYKSNLFYRAFEGMNPTLALEKQFVFNSVFEGGNLDCVIKVDECEFDLFMRVDSNTKGHVQWFYFSVRNGKAKKRIKLNLCNLSKAKSLYESGLQPYVLSKRKLQEKGVDWQQSGGNLGIEKKQLRYEYLQEIMPMRGYYCLELEYEFQYQNDEVFFAYCVPFTYSCLLNRISLLPEKYTRKAILGKTLAGVDIPILHITDHQQEREKKNILITGRMHPGESNSSHMLQGFIQFLNSSSRQAQELRSRVNFFIVPMVNPDGVIIGNSRTSAAGRDLNRQFLLAQRDLYPQVALVKELARRLQSKHGVFMYLDFHGHSRKKNTFFYGPAFPISEPNYYKSRILPKLIEKINCNFRFHSCSFAMDEQKKQTARVVMFEHFRIIFTYTIETSIGYFYDCQKMATLQFNQQEWNGIGGSIAEGLHAFLVGFQQYELLLKERRASRQKKRPITSKHTITELKLEAEEELNFFKRAEPLKIPYNDKTLFANIIDELKVPKTAGGYIKQIDDDQDSDAHDENEDFQSGKMAEFNNLLAHVAHHDKPREEKRKSIEKKVDRQRLMKQTQENELKYEEECRYFEEIVEVSKPATVQAARPHWRVKHPRESTRFQQKVSVDMKDRSSMKDKSSYHRMPINPAHSSKNERVKWKMLNHSIEKKIMSQVQFPSEKVSYFGQYHLFADKEETSAEKASSLKRHSLFSRERLRQNKRARPVENTHFSSESYLQKPPNEHCDSPKQGYRPVVAKSNYEFKFDEIEAVVIKQQLKSQLYHKIVRSTHSSVMGPASFYGIRQNLNLKIGNRRKIFEEDEGTMTKKSVKIMALK